METTTAGSGVLWQNALLIGSNVIALISRLKTKGLHKDFTFGLQTLDGAYY